MSYVETLKEVEQWSVFRLDDEQTLSRQKRFYTVDRVVNRSDYGRSRLTRSERFAEVRDAGRMEDDDEGWKVPA